ncbi:hypothetical protein QE364_001436 [Nocardioides zeae]|uniref:Uncharacterized protein n=1 Tax=Nocardioides zeae TaxID=1457234 RepID=A0ACC6IG50_9ACTN|nr:metallopeptidase family protein [Nocardioides zeae]MDR6176724.1 hypothetical protein [Nocardioides zeae]MDR6209736.1 hypothetical protein [Nocardioides zeae]
MTQHGDVPGAVPATGPGPGSEDTPAAYRPRRRDRHGRGGRGPGLAPSPGLRDPRPTRSQRFDRIVLGVVGHVDAPWRAELGELEYVVEEMPLLPDGWTDEAPLASVVPATADHPPRVVFFRRPLERRSETRLDLEELVRRVATEQLAELLGVSPETVDPDYDPDA